MEYVISIYVTHVLDVEIINMDILDSKNYPQMVLKKVTPKKKKPLYHDHMTQKSETYSVNK